MRESMPPAPDENDNLDADVAAAFFDGALEALDFAWSAIHIKRYDADDNPMFIGPDDYYHGIVRARIEVDNLRREYRAQREQADGLDGAR